MPEHLRSTQFAATVTWLGRVADRDEALQSAPVESLALGFAGPEGEAHGGLTRPACSRVSELYPRGTTIRNVRQLSILSVEEMALIAAEMGLDRLDPAWLGASVVVEGLPDFTRVPPSSRLQGPDGVTLVVDMENRPCQLPAKVIEGLHPGKGRGFKPAAMGRRGVTAWVEREGKLTIGDSLRLFIPDQPAWAHRDAVRFGAVAAE
jgi:hypothetical protein